MQPSTFLNWGTLRHNWLVGIGGQKGRKALIITGLMMGFLTAVGCSASPPSTSPSTQEIRSDSDRFFNKLGQEEHAKETTQSATGRASATK